MTQVDASISIIILTRNGGDNFPRLLERIYSQQYSGSYEVIVIDSGSTDGTLEAAHKYPLKLLEIKPEEFHHGRTRNLGADMAQGRYLVYITQDALPVNNDWLQKLTDNFADPQVAMVVGRQIPWEHTKPPEKFFYHYNFPDYRLVVKSDAVDYYHDNVFISDVNAAYRKDTWDKYRFKENIVMAEDKMIAAQILADGRTIIYEPLAAVYHSHDHGIKDVFNKWRYFGFALRQGVCALPGSPGSALQKALEYFIAEVRYFKANSCCRWLPYSAIYEIGKYSGLIIGKYCLSKRKSARAGLLYD
ncbi:MAG: glycosyltransferase [Dehalococcoidia bacterium]|jgi:rhamnosyltransferase